MPSWVKAIMWGVVGALVYDQFLKGMIGGFFTPRTGA